MMFSLLYYYKMIVIIIPSLLDCITIQSCEDVREIQSEVMSQSFSVLRQEADLYDVTLVSDDHTQISAHKLVLSASSQFFKSILRKNPHTHPLL